MSTDNEKRSAAHQALSYIKDGMIVGIGTGSTVQYLIDALQDSGIENVEFVSSSERSTQALRANGFTVQSLNDVGNLDLYIDGADEITPHGTMIKGGGGALTREKILATAARQFICIVDSSKQVDVLGAFPLPIEVIPMARSFVARRLVVMGGTVNYRQDCETDNGNVILDCTGLNLSDPTQMETTLNTIPGVLDNGLFSHRRADFVLVGN